MDIWISIVLSPVPELSFLPAPYRGWTRAGERRVQDNLHAHAQNEPIKNYQAPVVQRLDNAIQRINRYPVDKC